MLSLPFEIEKTILMDLSPRELLNYSEINKNCNYRILNNPYWRNIFPNLIVPSTQSIKDTVVNSRNELIERLKNSVDNLGFNQKLKFECVFKRNPNSDFKIKILLLNNSIVNPNKKLTKICYFTKKTGDLPINYEKYGIDKAKRSYIKILGPNTLKYSILSYNDDSVKDKLEFENLADNVLYKHADITKKISINPYARALGAFGSGISVGILIGTVAVYIFDKKCH